MFRRKNAPAAPRPNASADVPIYCLMGIIPETFGGMTTVLLQRSSALADLAGRRVEILTKSASMPDPTQRAKALHADGRLSAQVGIRNVWWDLRQLPDEGLADLASEHQASIPVDEELLEPDGSAEVRRRGEDGTVLQTDRFRDDGTRFLSDRQDVRTRGARGGRRLTVFDRSGQAVGQWPSMRALYHSWVDWAIGGGEAILIIDSAHTGGLFFDYQRENVTTVQVIHTHHTRQMRSDDRGELDPDVMKMFTHLDWYDGVAVLTNRQQTDLLEAGVVGGNSFVAPNMLIGAPENPPLERDVHRGVIAARLSGVKRLQHPIRAIQNARTAGVDARLDIYGDGVKEQPLRELIEELDVSDGVALKGYAPQARAQFQSASFTMLTSVYEGQGLVLLEAMAAGCIPIAYDIEYGPSDIITDGIDGFLVPNGDVRALATALERLTKMSDSELTAMRRAAIKRSQDFSPANITRLWNENLATFQERRKALGKGTAAASLTGLEMRDGGMHFEIDVKTSEQAASIQKVWVTWLGRGRNAFGRVPARLTVRDGVVHADVHVGADRLADVDEATLLDVHVDVVGEGFLVRTRISSRGVPMPVDSAGFVPYSTAHGNLSIKHVR